MANTKQLVLVIEGTAALGPYWNTIVSDYLEKIIRSFCGNKEPAGPIAELTLVNFNARAPFSSTSLVLKSGWTKNADVFMEWLSAINFNGGGASCDVAIAEGLAEVLMMFPSVHGSQNHERHCILVAASNPYPWPTSVYKPPDYLGTRSENHSSDAKTVAKYFKQCLVSLSVISPRQLPKLKEIYDAAKRNPSENDPTIDNVKNPDYLLLISQDFMEARVALTQPEITNLPSNQGPTIIDLTQESSPVSDPLVGNIPPVIFQEPGTGSSMAFASSSSLSTFQDMTSSLPLFQTVTSSTLPGTSTFQDMTSSLPLFQTVTPSTLPGTSTGAAMATNMATTIIPSTGTAMPTTGMQSVGPAQQTSTQLNFLKVWEGDLIDESERRITRVEAYRHWGDSQSLANDWPLTLKIEKVLPQKDVKNEKYIRKFENVFFRANDGHPGNEPSFVSHMREKKLYSVVNLPTSQMLVYAAYKPCALIGFLVTQISEEGDVQDSSRSTRFVTSESFLHGTGTRYVQTV
ncbi:hypothetical protein L2E82_43187 [Cichorium intybus]|uniref:Uncharacterized protein n=1 Tax=Cichorium intybus TaxID=13427 RepID=A0ACB8ZM99_CICIN|nr:hypothetical protein L2E82_43187 [Cichorium intybus]